MNQQIDYRSKYLKYKKKYLDFKEELKGGVAIKGPLPKEYPPMFDYNSKKFFSTVISKSSYNWTGNPNNIPVKSPILYKENNKTIFKIDSKLLPIDINFVKQLIIKYKNGIETKNKWESIKNTYKNQAAWLPKLAALFN